MKISLKMSPIQSTDGLVCIKLPLAKAMTVSVPVVFTLK